MVKCSCCTALYKVYFISLAWCWCALKDKPRLSLCGTKLCYYNYYPNYDAYSDSLGDGDCDDCCMATNSKLSDDECLDPYMSYFRIGPVWNTECLNNLKSYGDLHTV